MYEHFTCKFSFHLQVGEREYSLYLTSEDTTPNFKHKDNKVTIYAAYLVVDEDLSDKNWRKFFAFDGETVKFKGKIADGIESLTLYKGSENIRYKTRFSATRASSNK